jgi:hypothetical protein
LQSHAGAPAVKVLTENKKGCILLVAAAGKVLFCGSCWPCELKRINSNKQSEKESFFIGNKLGEITDFVLTEN